MKSNLFHSLICIVSIFACYIASTMMASAETNLEVLVTGTCGDNVTYTIYSDYSMVISGTGAMNNYSSSIRINNDYYSKIKKVIIEEGVTSIGDYAFHYFFGLTSVTIPNSVTSIGGNAFYRCSSLTSVTIPNSVTSIGDYAFSGCTGLTSVAIPNSVTSIGDYAFSSCTGLTSVTIPNSVTSIGHYAFFYCSGLTSVAIPNSVTSIGYYVFNGCSGLTSVTIPNSVTSIGDGAFGGCSGLTSVNIPNSMTSIGDGAFHGCSGLTSVTIPSSVISIGDGAFYRCNSLSSITVESGNTRYDSRDNCNAIIEKRTNRLIAGCKTTVIPNSVTDIGKDAFGYCSGLTSVTIPNSVTGIGNFAFRGCTGLTSVTIPNSVTSISYSAFSDCTGLTSVTILNSVTSIGSTAFSGCTGLTTITMESDVPLSIEHDTFRDVDKSTCTLYVPYGSKSAYENAQYWSEFQNIVELEDGGETKPSTYTDSQGVKYQLINNETAYKVTGHTGDFNHNLIIPASLFGLPVIEIGSDALGWSDLESVVLPEGIEIIGMNAISDCYITSLVIPASVNSLYPSDDNAFSNDRLLSSIRVEEGNEVYDSRDNCNAIIETATNRLVSGCMNTVIPQSVTSIGRDAFYASQFSSITLPSGITSIGEIAFTSCDKLNTIYAMMTTPASVVNGAFENYHYSNVTLYVPKGSKTLYEQANVWRNFQNIVEFEDGGSTEPEDGVLQPDGTTTWTTFQGVKMTFKVIDAEKKWVQVGNGVDPSISQATTGEVTIPNEIVIDGETYTVVGIGDYGFYNCDKLTAIWLPDNLQFIGKYAFYGCKLVGKIQIPETVYAIDDTAFEGCTGLTEISCPYIPGYSYPSVPDLIIIGYKPSDEDYDVVIPQPVTSIGERAFSYCATIRTMRVEEGNTVFDSRDNCNAIIRTADNVLLFGCKSTVIPSSVTAIDAYAFEGHTGLTTIAIPASVASIGQGAFADCTGLTTVTSNIQSPYAINDNTFSTTTYETATLKVPHGTKSAYKAADGWKNFLNIVEEEEVISDEPIVFADAEVKRICVENWDTNSDGELSYSEAASVTELGETFKNTNIEFFEELQYFTGLTALSADAFYGCRKLTSITIPASTTNIGGNPFGHCSILTEVSVADGNPVYDSRDNCNAVIETATNTLVIGSNSCIIPEGIVKLGNQAFAGYTLFETINLPSSLRILGNQVFIDCSSLTSIDLNNVTEINYACFSAPLTSVHIPASVVYIRSNAFSDYYGTIETITVDPENLYYDSRENCNAIILRDGKSAIDVLVSSCKNTVIPNSVRTIGNNAFEYYKGKTIDIPEGVESILNSAFSFSEIETIKMPKSLNFIDEYAFLSCKKLSSITVQNEEPLPIDGSTFRYVNKFTCTLYVPKGSKSAYENAENWSDFENIIELGAESDQEILATGQCGDNLTYAIYSDYSMVISGTGEMWDYDYSCITPDYKDLVLELTIEEGVTDIGAFAFAQFTGITSLTIPNSVTTIGKFSFGYCPSLTSVDFGSGVSSIGNYAFNSCQGLVSLTIPDNVIGIDDYAFAGCSNLTSLTIGSGLRGMGTCPFADCNNLSSIIVDERNERYDSRDNCNALISSYNGLLLGCKNTIIPDGVVSIESHAFDGCTGLTSITIPNSVSSICSYAFAGCTGLTSLVIPNSVTSIGASAFYGCTGLTSITSERVAPARTEYGEIFEDIDKSACILYVPSGSKSIYENADYWKAFENIVEYGEERVVLAMGECGDNVRYVIYEDMTMLIVGVGEMWWYGSDSHINDEYYQSIQKVVVDEGVTEIGGGAFRGCTNLSSVTLSNSVTTINDGSFSDCTSLNLVSFGNNVTTIDGAFIGCTGLSTITIPNSVKTINGAFYGCTGLSSVTIGNNVETIGLRTFRDCTSLTSLAIPNSVMTIDTEAFYNCTALTDISFGNGLKTIGRQAFQNCGLTSLFIPKSVSSITSGYLRDAFTCCSSLSSIVVESGNEIYDSRDNCNAIIETSTNKLIVGSNNTIIPTSVTTIGGWAFHYRFGLTEIVIPDNVTKIETEAFYYCKNLASVTLPNGITRIEFGTFDSYNKLTSITIPKSVISIGAHAFQCSQYLSTITVESSTPATIEAETTFSWVNKSTCTLYVPYGSKSAYENAEYWNEFENIVEIDDDPDTDISEYDNIVYIDGTEAVVGQRVRLSLNMNNTIVPTAFQCDVYLPDGVTAAWELDEDGNRSYLMGVNEGRTTTQRHALQGAEQPDGCLRILCNSVMNYSISGNEGEVAYLMVDIDPDMEEGTYPLILRNIEVTDANLNAVIVDYVKTSLTIVTHAPGDANGDSRVSVSDLTAIANHILGRTYASFDEKAADVNVDGRISVSDLTGVANIILYGTVSPHASNAKERGDSELVNVNIDAYDVSATMGEEFTAAVNISGNYAYSGYQFDVTLPEGITVKDVGGQTTGSDLFMSGMIDDNTLRVLCASTTGETTESSVVYLTLVAESAGPYSIDIDNAIVSANASSFAIYESSFLVDIDSNATGISTLSDEAAGNASVYDLTGKMWNGDMSKLPKGIYIINGNKFSK